MRELHWHATAAEWAFVLEGRVRTTVVDPHGCAETNDFEPGDVWYFPARPRPHAAMPGQRAVPFHPDLRQRLLFRVRHLQHHRLDRPCSAGAVGQEFRRARSSLRQISQETKSILHAARFRPRAARRCRCRAGSCRRETHKYRLLAQPPHSRPHGRPRMARRLQPFPDLHNDHRRRARPRSGRPARRCTGIPTPTSGNTSSRARSASRCSARTAASAPKRSHQGDVGYIPQGYGHSIENVGTKPCRVLIGFNTGDYEAIDLSQWIAGNPVDVLATNFGQPAGSVCKSSRIATCSSPTRMGSEDALRRQTSGTDTHQTRAPGTSRC